MSYSDEKNSQQENENLESAQKNQKKVGAADQTLQPLVPPKPCEKKLQKILVRMILKNQPKF